MRKLIWGLGAASAVSLGAASTMAAEQQFYVTGNLGLFQLSDLEDSVGDEISFDMGPYLSGAAGMAFDNGARVELELGYASFEGDEAEIGGVTQDAGFVESSATIVTVGGYYDIQTEGSVSPYVGAGLGLAAWEIDGATDFDGTDLAAFGEAGLNIKASERVTVAPSYRLLWVDNGEQGIDDSTAHIFKVGVRYAF
jgi:opacity protein-like surface antigen